MTHRLVARRSLMGTGASLLLLGAAEAGHAKAQELDGELLAACESFDRVRARIAYLCAHSPGTPFRHPRTVAHEAQIEAANEAWDEALERAARLPARTPEGLRAKARLAQVAMEEIYDDGTEPGAYTIVVSVMSDLLGRA